VLCGPRQCGKTTLARELLRHPKVGASWAGFAIEQVLATQSHYEAFFWATHQHAEIDLILRRGHRLFGVECKRADAPRMTNEQLVSKAWNYAHVLRDQGISCGDYVEQITCLLFLKMDTERVRRHRQQGDAPLEQRAETAQ